MKITLECCAVEIVCLGIAAERWNGWAIPLFTEAQLATAVATLTAAGIDATDRPETPNASGVYAWDGWTWLATDENDPDA
jgi:hypothetical protein